MKSYERNEYNERALASCIMEWISKDIEKKCVARNYITFRQASQQMCG